MGNLLAALKFSGAREQNQQELQHVATVCPSAVEHCWGMYFIIPRVGKAGLKYPQGWERWLQSGGSYVCRLCKRLEDCSKGDDERSLFVDPSPNIREGSSPPPFPFNSWICFKGARSEGQRRESTPPTPAAYCKPVSLLTQISVQPFSFSVS